MRCTHLGDYSRMPHRIVARGTNGKRRMSRFGRTWMLEFRRLPHVTKSVGRKIGGHDFTHCTLLGSCGKYARRKFRTSLRKFTFRIRSRGYRLRRKSQESNGNWWWRRRLPCRTHCIGKRLLGNIPRSKRQIRWKYVLRRPLLGKR